MKNIFTYLLIFFNKKMMDETVATNTITTSVKTLDSHSIFFYGLSFVSDTRSKGQPSDINKRTASTAEPTTLYELWGEKQDQCPSGGGVSISLGLHSCFPFCSILCHLIKIQTNETTQNGICLLLVFKRQIGSQLEKIVSLIFL